MKVTGVSSLMRLAVDTLRDPKRGLRIILDVVITMPELIQAALLVSVLVMIPPTAFLFLLPDQTQQTISECAKSPYFRFTTQIVFLFGTAALITVVGGWFKGFGTFKEALTAMVWLQAILIIFHVVQFLVSLVSLQLSVIIALASTIAMFYLLINFVMEVHGFKKTGTVVIGTFGTFIAAAFGLSILLTLLGFSPEAIQQCMM